MALIIKSYVSAFLVFFGKVVVEFLRHLELT